MSTWAAKRFWKSTSVVEVEDGFTVHLDSRAVRTPAKNPLVVPTGAMAEAIAIEWDVQEGKIDPRTMPVTRSSNAAIDKVRAQRDEVASLIADYGDSDLLCYRAPSPKELRARQDAAWDPILNWATAHLGVDLHVVDGIIHKPQSDHDRSRMHGAVAELTDFELTAFHDLVSMSGSLLIGFAVLREHLPIEKAWICSRIDESWQEEHWGEDEEASNTSELKRAAFYHAKRFLDLLKNDVNHGKKQVYLW